MQKSDNTQVFEGTIVWKYVVFNRPSALRFFYKLIKIVHTFVQYKNNASPKFPVDRYVMKLRRSFKIDLRTACRCVVVHGR